MLATDTSWNVVIGVPKGSVMKGFTLDASSQNLNLFVEHEEFEEIDIESEVAPKLEMLFKKL